MKDISGEGVKFVIQQADKYFLGQPLEITVFLPGTDEVKACVKGKVTVVRIDPPGGSGIGEESRGAYIAVKIDTPLYFERVDMKTEGNHRESTRKL